MTRLSQVYVVDSGVLFTTWIQKIKDGTFVTISGVLDEVRNRPSKLRTDILLVLDSLREEAPDKSSLEAVQKAAKEMGDYKVLSEVDLELIGLALMKKDQGVSIAIVSTDLALLNTAKHLGIRIIDPSGKFQRKIVWSLRCPACKHVSKSKLDSMDCPICGTQMRRVASSKRKNR